MPCSNPPWQCPGGVSKDSPYRLIYCHLLILTIHFQNHNFPRPSEFSHHWSSTQPVKTVGKCFLWLRRSVVKSDIITYLGPGMEMTISFWQEARVKNLEKDVGVYTDGKCLKARTCLMCLLTTSEDKRLVKSLPSQRSEMYSLFKWRLKIGPLVRLSVLDIK